MPASIFISHRRSDIGGHGRLLHERLMQWFDGEAVFYDTQMREAGDVLPERIEAALRSAQVVLVAMGPSWLRELNHRVQLPMRDYVALEVACALRRQAVEPGLAVIPVLMGGAEPISSAEALHASVRADLQGLCSLRAHEFHGGNRVGSRQFVALRELLSSLPGVPAPRYRTAAGATQPFRTIPRRLSAHFRDPDGALEQVHARLHTVRHAAILAPVQAYGLGGVGKTQLALKYSHEHRDAYAGVWWFRAETAAYLQLDAGDACQETGAAVAKGELPMLAFMRWLERQQQRWLLVFDNVEYDQESKHTLLPSGCLQLPQHHVLITSRHPVADIAPAIELSGWSAAAGADFLAARVPRAPPAELERLSRALGGLPLALEQAAAFLEGHGVSVADYRRQIESVDSFALTLVEGRASTRHERAVHATLSLSFQRLQPAAQQLLRLCGFCNAELIPERYFRESIEHLPAELAAAARSAPAWSEVVGELHRFGIAERHDMPSFDRAASQPGNAVEPALLLHRLTLEVARRTLSVAPEDGPRAQRLLRAQCPADPVNPAQWPRFAMLHPHLLQLDKSRTTRWLERRMHAWMLSAVARYLRTQGDLPAARVLQEQALAIRRRVEGSQHPDTLQSMNSLAGTLWAEGRSDDAIKLMSEAVEQSAAAFGSQHAHTAQLSKRLEQMRSTQSA